MSDMKDYIAKQAYDKGYDAGVRASREAKYVAVNPYRKTRWGNGRDGYWEMGCRDGWEGRPRRISQEEAEHRERERMATLEAFRNAVLKAFSEGLITCECHGPLHEADCPLSTLEVEADAIRQNDSEVTA